MGPTTDTGKYLREEASPTELSLAKDGSMGRWLLGFNCDQTVRAYVPFYGKLVRWV
jgi:hypothetical protein